MPTLKIGSQVRIGPGPGGVIQRSASQPILRSHIAHVANDDDSIGEAPSFRSSLEVATPGRRTHRRYSSSVDFTASPDFRGALASTPHTGAARHSMLKHETTASLPDIPPADFADVRRSFEDCGRTPRKSDAPPGEALGEQEMGVDLPPIPASMYAFSRRHLSRLTERDETNESSLMRETMADMRGAILAVSSPAPSFNASVARADATAPNRMDLADLAPIIQQGDSLDVSMSSSMQSEGTLMAEEMERVMEMDTPTRTEFVISPPASSYASSLGGRDSRASLWTTRSTSTIGLNRMPSVASRYSVARATTPSGQNEHDIGPDITPGRYTDADESSEYTPQMAVEVNMYAPITPGQYAHTQVHYQPHAARAKEIDLDIPELRDYKTLQRATSMPGMSAHPHPAPATASVHRVIQPATSVPNFSRPGTPSAAAGIGAGAGTGAGLGPAVGVAMITSPHPPVPLEELRTLRTRRSAETFTSDAIHAARARPAIAASAQGGLVMPVRSRSAMGQHEAMTSRAVPAGKRGRAGSMGPVKVMVTSTKENQVSRIPVPVSRAKMQSDGGKVAGGISGVKSAGNKDNKGGKVSTRSMGSGKENETAKLDKSARGRNEAS